MRNPVKSSQDNNEQAAAGRVDAFCGPKAGQTSPQPWNQEAARSFFDRMTEMYSVRSSRIDSMAWERLLMSQPLYDSNHRTSASFAVLDFFVKHPYLTHDTWVLYNTFFGWTAMETVVPPESAAAIHTVVHEVDTRFAMHLDHVPEDEHSEKYLAYRRNMRDAAIDDKRDDVRRFYELASHLCTSDPELFRIAFRYYDGLKHWEQTSAMISYAWEALTRYLSLCPDDLEMEMMRAEYLLKRGFDTEALNEFKTISKKYPLHLSALYKRMECFLVLHDKAGASSQRNVIRNSYTRVQKQLEHDRLQSNSKEEIDHLLAENKQILDELNEKYPQSQLSPQDIRHRPFFKILAAAAVILVIGVIYFGFTGLKNLTGGSSPSGNVYVPDETVPKEVSEALLNFADSIQMRYPNDVFAHSMTYDRYGYLEFSLQSMQKFDENLQDKILKDISNFVATRKITFSDEYTPVLWKVRFQPKDQQEIIYFSDPVKISQNKQFEVREVWLDEKI